MDKETEIKHLKALQGDTYFAQFFGTDIDQMVQNIKNDFPIEYGCKFAAQAKVAANVPPTREEVEFLIEQAKNQ